MTVYGKELWVYKWIQRYKKGKSTNVNNLQRACRNNNIRCPHKMSLEQAVIGELATEKKLMDQQKCSPEERYDHLVNQLVDARSKKHLKRERAIMRMLRATDERKSNGRT